MKEEIHNHLSWPRRVLNHWFNYINCLQWEYIILFDPIRSSCVWISQICSVVSKDPNYRWTRNEVETMAITALAYLNNLKLNKLNDMFNIFISLNFESIQKLIITSCITYRDSIQSPYFHIHMYNYLCWGVVTYIFIYKLEYLSFLKYKYKNLILHRLHLGF